MGEAEELEDMRGAKFLWREHDDVADAASRVAKKMEKEMIKKMTALERYHLRKERKMSCDNSQMELGCKIAKNFFKN